jgi:2,4-dienoyl-CoA reductase-like NADH-dependent reductase (Old Yellow Enzyme family)
MRSRDCGSKAPARANPYDWSVPLSPASPLRLGSLTLRNRLIKAATFEGLARGGHPTEALVEHHRRIAAGGAALTTVAYAAVSAEGRSYATQLLMSPAIVDGLRQLTDAVHREGAAASLQIGHCGDFANPRVIGGRALGPSRRFVAYGLAFARAMSESDIERVTSDFVAAARQAREAGFDAVELHLGHGYLLSQFLSPFANRRRDRWGGSLEGRMRFARQVVRRVRAALGADFPVLAKINLRDGFPGGLEVDEAIEVARAIADDGASALVLSGGFVSRTPFYMLRGDLPIAEMASVQPSVAARVGLTLFGRLMVPRHPFTESFFLDEARRMRASVRLPLVLLGGVKSRARVDEALAAGFELVGMARALIHDPDLPRRLLADTQAVSDCVPCNRCVAEMDRGGVRCVRR